MTTPETTPEARRRLDGIIRGCLQRGFRPRPRLTVSEWADQYRKLSPEASAEHGQWYTARAEYQRGIMDAFSAEDVEQIVIMSSAQIGKALALDTPLPTPDGWVSMGEVRVGDRLFDETGTPCRVTAVSPVMHERSCNKVTFNDGSSIVADDEHRWYVEPSIGDCRRSPCVKTTKELAGDLHTRKGKGKSRNNWCVPVADPLDLPHVSDLPLRPYVLGIWLGDGNSQAAQITVADGDIDEMRWLLASEGYRVERRDWKDRASSLIFNPRRPQGHCRRYETAAEYARAMYRHRRYGEEINALDDEETGSAALRRAGVLKNKHIPAAYMRASARQRLDLLQGLMDSDGYPGVGTCEFSTTSPLLAKQFIELAASLGFKPVMKEGQATIAGRVTGPKFRVTFRAYLEQEPFRLTRKLARLRSEEAPGSRPTETKRRFIISIEPVGSVPVRCVAVDSLSHLYLAGNAMIPTHNTEVLNNIVGYFIDRDPSPVLVIQPTLTMGETWSKDRLAPMLRDTPALKGKVKDPRARDSGNTTLHKIFPGGHVTIAGSNSPQSLASRPIRVVLCDEVDRYPSSAGSEGDPISLAIKRTATFHNKKVALFSTPTVEGASRIAAAFEETDQRFYYIPCPDCGEEQRLEWAQVRWDKAEDGTHLPETATYSCKECGSCWSDGQRWAAVARGQWRATAAFRGRAGFHLSELYSTWRKLSDTVRDFLDAKGNADRLKTWTNTALGETYREKGDAPEWQRLYERREEWNPAILPAGVLLLSVGIDVQRDRLEARVWGRGRDGQRWLVDRQIFTGDPLRPETWQPLTALLRQSWQHEGGAELNPCRYVIDSGDGLTTEAVYAWARNQNDRRLMVIKGQAQNASVIGQPSAAEVNQRGQKVKIGLHVWPVNTASLKSKLYSAFRLDAPLDGEPHPEGWVHLPKWADETECKQLTAEQIVTVRKRGGYPRREWALISGRHNEALDCACYADIGFIHARVEQFSDSKWDEIEASLTAEPAMTEREAQQAAASAIPRPAPVNPFTGRPMGRGFRR